MSETPSVLYREFEEEGVEVKIFAPRSDGEELAWSICVKKGVKEKTVLVPMMYRPVFGYDFEDVQNLEEALDKYIREINGEEAGDNPK